ncbi:MAG: hypothetical protein WD355_12740 [Balneolaceae bacterium]
MQSIIYLICFVSVLIAGTIGYRRQGTIDQITPRFLLNGILMLLLGFTVLMIAWAAGYFTQVIAAPFMMVLYSLTAGFILGSAVRLSSYRLQRGRILYIHRSFWTDHAPNLAAIVLILFGLYRTAVLTELPVTGIRLTSGLSIIAAGLFGWTLRLVPEFRISGILHLDRWIPWSRVIAWRWVSEEALLIEYLQIDGDSESKKIRNFITSIPAGERKKLEYILSSQMDAFREKREALLTGGNSR